jgi:hypothetical protein
MCSFPLVAFIGDATAPVARPVCLGAKRGSAERLKFWRTENSLRSTWASKSSTFQSVEMSVITYYTIGDSGLEGPASERVSPGTTVASFKLCFAGRVVVYGTAPDFSDVLGDDFDLTSMPNTTVIVISCDSAAPDPPARPPTRDHRWSGTFCDMVSEMGGEDDLARTGCSPVRPVPLRQVFSPLAVVPFRPPASLPYTDEQNDDIQAICLRDFSPRQAVTAYETHGRNCEAALNALLAGRKSRE